MALSIPGYMKAARVQDRVIRYKWDDWDVNADEASLDEAVSERLGRLSQRAVLAFTIATAEWIVYRYGALVDEPMPSQYLQAAWAQIVDWHYGALTIEGDTDPREWAGPIKRPIWWGLLQTDFAIDEAEDDGEPEVGAVRVATLAEHVMTDPSHYRAWRERILERLEALYPMDPEEHLGEVVPREALDPDFDFHVDDTEALTNGFLSSLDHETNPFLNSPENMLNEGFEGTPYVFDLGSDRRRRLEW